MKKACMILAIVSCIITIFAMLTLRTEADITLTQLTTNPYQDTWPSWHPLGSKIVYCAFSNDWDRSIWVLNFSNPSNKVALTAGSIDECPSFSSDGQKIVFVRWGLRGDYHDIMIMNSDGTNVQRITSGAVPGLDEGCYHSPQFSNDGSEILFEYWPYTSPGAGPDRYIGIMNNDGSNVRIIGNGTNPHWSHDNSRIVYNYPDIATGPSSIYIMNSDGTNVSKLTTGTTDCEPDISTTGKIVFSRGSDLYTMNPDGSNIQMLIDDGRQPHWSPDGNYIVFRSEQRSSNRDLWALGSVPSLSASISPLSASIHVGNSVTFTSTVSGGTPPYNYQWYLDGNPVSGATSSSWMFTPTTSGIYYVSLKATDAIGNTTQSETARITVASVPVGGYSFPIEGHTSAKPLTPYLTLMAVIAIGFIVIRRKTTRNAK